jgi:hypothetical protein
MKAEVNHADFTRSHVQSTLSTIMVTAMQARNVSGPRDESCGKMRWSTLTLTERQCSGPKMRAI